jgi:hypothetical protein
MAVDAPTVPNAVPTALIAVRTPEAPKRVVISNVRPMNGAPTDFFRSRGWHYRDCRSPGFRRDHPARRAGQAGFPPRSTGARRSRLKRLLRPDLPQEA